MDQKNLISVVTKLLPSLKMMGLDVDSMLEESLKELPNIANNLKQNIQAENPGYEIVLMIAEHDEDVFIIPVALDDFEGDKEIIEKKFNPINITELLTGLKISEVLKVLEKNPELTFLQAAEYSKK